MGWRRGLGRKPVIAILNTWSEAQACHMHSRAGSTNVKRGSCRRAASMELPALSLSESFLKPTTMLYATLLAMDAESCCDGHPVDGVVLMAVRKDHARIAAGRDQHGHSAIYCRPVRCCAATGKASLARAPMLEYWTSAARARFSDDGLGRRSEAGIARSYGTLHDHGHGRHHDAIAENTRHVLPGASSIRQPTPITFRMAAESGAAHRRHGVGRPDTEQDPTREAFLNAITVAMAVGCLDQRHQSTWSRWPVGPARISGSTTSSAPAARCR